MSEPIKSIKITKKGRPTKYDPEMISMVHGYVKECAEQKQLPTKAKLARRLGIDKETLVRWVKEKEDFSNAVKEIEMDQEDMLVNLGLSSKYNPTMCIFLLKNNHGYSDRVDQSIDINVDGEIRRVYAPEKLPAGYNNGDF
jgi:DNA-binding XRE family transcriptional regulator